MQDLMNLRVRCNQSLLTRSRFYLLSPHLPALRVNQSSTVLEYSGMVPTGLDCDQYAWHRPSSYARANLRMHDAHVIMQIKSGTGEHTHQLLLEMYGYKR